MTTALATAAHVLLQADPGRAADVATHLNTLDGITEAMVTSGPFDVIALVSAEADLEHVLANVRRAPGLARLCLCRAKAAS